MEVSDKTACYKCIINASDPSIKAIDDYSNSHSSSSYRNSVNMRKKAYYSALATQKLRLSKASSFINGSDEIS